MFDGSCKTSTRVSLNDLVVYRFRINQIVFTADIAKIYRQILVNEPDRKYQRILWSHNPREKIFNLATVTFDTSVASFLAIRTLQQLAYDDGATFQSV